jgi:hypothetical protein
MSAVLSEQTNLLEKCFPDARRSGSQRRDDSWAIVINPHQRLGGDFLDGPFFSSFFREAIIPSAVSNGPAVCPLSTSARAFFRRASILRRWAGVYSSTVAATFWKDVNRAA